jgi:hypothetical protein
MSNWDIFGNTPVPGPRKVGRGTDNISKRQGIAANGKISDKPSQKYLMTREPKARYRHRLHKRQQIWPSVGHGQMIAVYSRSQIAHQLGYPEATELAEQARAIFAETGRQYHFTGHGTIWPDIIGSMEERQGRPRMIPKRF